MQNSFYQLQHIIQKMRNPSGSLMELSPFGYMWTAVNSPTLVASHTIYSMLEKEAFSEFFTVQSWKNCVHQKDLFKLIQAEEDLLQTGDPAIAEYRLITETGRHIYVQHHMYLSGSPGTKQKIMSIVHNVTEQKRAEIILEAMNEGFFELDENFAFRRINEHALKFWGLQHNDAAGKKICAVFPQIEGTSFHEILVKAQDEKNDIAQEIQEPVTGHWLHLSVAPYADGLIVTFYDKEKEKEAELQLLELKDQLAKKATDKYYSLFNSINQGFCIIEMIWDENEMPVDYRFLEINPAFEKQTGIINAAGRTMREIEPSHESHWFETYGKVAKTGRPLHFEQKAGLLMGGWYDVHAFPIDKERNRVALLFADITERKNAEEQKAKAEKDLLESEQKHSLGLQHEVEERTTELKEKKNEIADLNIDLQLKNKQLESLIAELKTFNSLAANNYTETLRQVYINLETIVINDARSLSNTSRANLRRAQAAIQKMKLLTTDINLYLELYDINTRKELLDPNDILTNVKEKMQRKIEDSNATINIASLQQVFADPLLFTKLMTHILDNAIKHKKPEVPPIINITCCSMGAELSSLPYARKNTTYNIITITDNGPGFKEEEAEKIFQLFTQLDDGKHKGSGIGLAICKKIMDMHGGFITAQSKPGEGAMFNCYFPA